MTTRGPLIVTAVASAAVGVAVGAAVTFLTIARGAGDSRRTHAEKEEEEESFEVDHRQTSDGGEGRLGTATAAEEGGVRNVNVSSGSAGPRRRPVHRRVSFSNTSYAPDNGDSDSESDSDSDGENDSNDCGDGDGEEESGDDYSVPPPGESRPESRRWSQLSQMSAESVTQCGKGLRTDVVIGASEDDREVREARQFDDRVVSNIGDLAESLRLLRRTRAVTAVINRLMQAPDEFTCFEEVTRLLVPLFAVDRCSYALLTDPKHFTLKKVTVQRRDFATSLGLEFQNTDSIIKLEGTAVGYCADTLEALYTPRTEDSPYKAQRMIHSMGLNTVFNVPILVNGRKFAGCINIALAEEDALTEHDRILLRDIAAMLGAHIYAKRLQGAEAAAHRVSRELLHSIIPPKVLKKIECFWDEESEEYQTLRSSVTSSASNSFMGSQRLSSDSIDIEDEDEDGTEEETSGKDRWRDIRGNLSLITGLNRQDATEESEVGVMVDTSAACFDATSRALYAEDAENVCIIFTDIVGFSRISMNVAPIKVMDMLQDLFNRFDNLCEDHGVLKFETIGDAYLCSTGLLEDGDGSDGGRDAALRALAMAKDMICAARQVVAPRPPSADRHVPPSTLQIRVGIHVGSITCGVLGQRMPKFTVYGTAVNMAARMEQTSFPGKIRVTKDFHDLVGDSEAEWEDRQIVSVKNMGEVDTYLLDPLWKKTRRQSWLGSSGTC